MNNIQTLTVYLGSSGHARGIYNDAADALGHAIAEHGKNLIYGGMDAGLMGILAMNAMQAGAHVTGIIPQKLKDSERILSDLSETILVPELCDRKKQMFLMADAIVSLPGGFGTLDESLEVLYWGYLQFHNKPLALINIDGYWNPLIAYLKTLPDYDERFLVVVESVDDVFEALNGWAPPLTDIKIPQHLPHFEDEICRDTAEPIFIDKASVENTYYAVCALGLKQLGKHSRAIGLYNKDGQFNDLQTWIKSAANETFITKKCLKLYDIDDDEDRLRTTLKNQNSVSINLHEEKWGAAKDA